VGAGGIASGEKERTEGTQSDAIHQGTVLGGIKLVGSLDGAFVSFGTMEGGKSSRRRKKGDVGVLQGIAAKLG